MAPNSRGFGGRRRDGIDPSRIPPGQYYDAASRSYRLGRRRGSTELEPRIGLMLRHSLVSYAVFLAGFALVAGHYFTWQLTDVLLDEERRKKLQKVLHRPKLVGVVERTLFVVTILAGQAAFIVAWLALTAIGAGTWGRGDDDERPGDRDLYQRFLIGSGVSLLFAIAAAKSIEWTSPCPRRRTLSTSSTSPVLA